MKFKKLTYLFGLSIAIGASFAGQLRAESIEHKTQSEEYWFEEIITNKRYFTTREDIYSASLSNHYGRFTLGIQNGKEEALPPNSDPTEDQMNEARSVGPLWTEFEMVLRAIVGSEWYEIVLVCTETPYEGNDLNTSVSGFCHDGDDPKLPAAVFSFSDGYGVLANSPTRVVLTLFEFMHPARDLNYTMSVVSTKEIGGKNLVMGFPTVEVMSFSFITRACSENYKTEEETDCEIR